MFAIMYIRGLVFLSRAAHLRRVARDVIIPNVSILFVMRSLKSHAPNAASRTKCNYCANVFLFRNSLTTGKIMFLHNTRYTCVQLYLRIACVSVRFICEQFVGDRRVSKSISAPKYYNRLYDVSTDGRHRAGKALLLLLLLRHDAFNIIIIYASSSS